MRNLGKLNLTEMKNILTTLLLLLSVVSFSQTKVQLEVENENGKEQYKLKLEREVDGETVITEKTYDSKEAMENDPELEGLDLHIMEGNGVSMSGDGDDKHVIIKIDNKGFDESHKTMFSSEDDGSEEVNLEVRVDEDGTKHIFKNGEEINLDELHEGGENVFVFKTDGNNSLHIEESMEVEVTVNGKEVDYKEWAKGSENGENKMAKKIIIIKKDGGGQKEIKYEVIVKQMVLHIEEVSAEDEKAFSIEEHKALKLDEFNFYPNPTNGILNLKFAGKEKPTVVRITDINGKEVYAENLQNFTGIYDKEISLSDLKKGIYLLQVVQGSKAVNKKIIIE